MSDDTISRQAAIDALDEYIEEYSYDLDENGYHNPKWCAMQEAKMTIQRLPSAEQLGRWIRTGEDGYCSVCKCDMPMFRNDWEWEYTETPYCPNCGARMEG